MRFVSLFCLRLRSLSPITFAQATQYSNQPPILLGAAWYPEQWPESRWDADLSLMEAAHIHVVRVGEFAWSTMEPSEGHYDFAWLDRAIALAAKHHICVVLGTPTAAPPAWLTEKYPETLRIERGRRARRAWQSPAVLLHRSEISRVRPRYRRTNGDSLRP